MCSRIRVRFRHEKAFIPGLHVPIQRQLKTLAVDMDANLSRC